MFALFKRDLFLGGFMKLHAFSRSRLAVAIFGVFLAVILSLFIVLLVNSRSHAKDNSFIYRSVRIEDGDTLNSIAGRFLSDSGMSRHSDFVREISRVNRLSSDKIISGAYLVIPMLESSRSH